MTNTISKVIKNGTEYQFKDTTYSAGTGISITGTTIANTGVTSVNNNSGVVTLKTINSTALDGSGDIAITPFSPSNTGSTGQVLTKTANGYNYADAPVTSVGGSTGAVTLKTINSTALTGSGNITALTAETVVSGDSGTTYTIKTSNSAPTSGTANNVITLVF